MESLKDKIILITGGTSGIGKEIVKSLLNVKTTLLLIGRNEKMLKQISNERNKVAEVIYAKVDLANDKDINLFINKLKESLIEPDILIHGAGVFHYANISSTSNDILDQEYKVNFRAPFILTRELLDAIKEKKGQIVFINSLASIKPKSNLSAYATSKGALKIFAEVLKHEVHSSGVRITTIYPSRVATPMQELACELEGIPYTPDTFISPKTIADTVINVISLPSHAEISDIIIRTNP